MPLRAGAAALVVLVMLAPSTAAYVSSPAGAAVQATVELPCLLEEGLAGACVRSACALPTPDPADTCQYGLVAPGNAVHRFYDFDSIVCFAVAAHWKVHVHHLPSLGPLEVRITSDHSGVWNTPLYALTENGQATLVVSSVNTCATFTVTLSAASATSVALAQLDVD